MQTPLESLYAMFSGTQSPAPSDAGKSLQAFLTARPSANIDTAAWPLLDELWQQETAGEQFMQASDLSRIGLPRAPQGRFSHGRGDITTLSCDAVVNAANSVSVTKTVVFM